MKLEPGKRYLTKRGEIVVITQRDPSNTLFCMRGYIETPSGQIPSGWHEDGRASAIAGDIVAEIAHPQEL